MSTRREFVSTSGSALGGAWLARFAPVLALTQACAREAAEEGRPFVTFSQEEGADFEAYAARIIPTTDTPGATEAGVVHFVDQALSTHFPWMVDMIRGGMGQLRGGIDTGGEPGAFAALTDAEQDERIRGIENDDPEFFFMSRTLITLGMFTNPSYGGNRNRIGWNLIGFRDTFGYQPPFGSYDRGEHGPDGEGA